MKKIIFVLSACIYSAAYAAQAAVDKLDIVKDSAYLIWHTLYNPCYKYYRNPKAAGFKLDCRCEQEDWLDLKNVGDVITYHNLDGKLLGQQITYLPNSHLIVAPFTKKLDPSCKPKAKQILITKLGCYIAASDGDPETIEKFEILDWMPYQPNKVKMICDIMDQSSEYVDFSTLKKVRDGTK